MKKLLVLLTMLLTSFFAETQKRRDYWNNKLKLISFRLPLPVGIFRRLANPVVTNRINKLNIYEISYQLFILSSCIFNEK